MNRKLKLSLDELSVESFHVTRPAGQEGTVHAHETGQWDVSCQSCGGTCAGSCDLSCGCEPSAMGGCVSDHGCYPNSWDDFSCRFTCQTCDRYTQNDEITG